MVQFPGASSIAVVPETAQIDGVVEARLTGSPVEALAVNVVEDELRNWLPGFAKVMVWASCVTTKLCPTLVA
jgi:hypothetical protein